MSTTIFTQTEEVLSQSNKYKSSDGKLLRNAVLEAAEKMDAELLSILLKNDLTKKTYFTEVNDIQVFDKQKFAWIIQNKNFLPDSYTRYKNKIGLVDSRGDFISSSNDVELVFPYKDCILEGGQTKEEQKNNEIFYNETLAPDQVSTLLAPKAFCNAKKYDKDGVHELTEISETDNLIIKGNNLLALSSLLEKYRGKVKCCYLDPPYNTGSDSFKYNDRFNHSTWLTFMKNRLELAKKLLRDDGCIFVQIDNSPSDLNNSPEYAYLAILLDEVFGRQNYISVLTWKKKGNASNTQDGLGTITESILFYAKNINSIDINLLEYKRVYKYEDELGSFNLESPIKTNAGDYERTTMQFCIKTPEGEFYPPNGKRWTIGEETAKNIIENKKYKIDNGEFKIKKYREDYKKGENTLFNNLLLDHGSLKSAKSEIASLGFNREEFSSPKPEILLKRIIEMVTQPQDIILDFYLGSGTTAAVAHKMNRKYIGVEQMDYIKTISCERLKKVIAGEQGGISKSQNWQGGGSFIYCELAKLNQNFVDKIQSCKTDEEIKSLTDEILKSDFVSSKVKPSEINTNVKDYSDLSLEEKQKFAMELLDKNQLYVNFSERNDPDMKLSENDIKFTESFYNNLH